MANLPSFFSVFFWILYPYTLFSCLEAQLTHFASCYYLRLFPASSSRPNSTDKIQYLIQALSQIISSLKSVSTFFCSLNKMCIMTEASPREAWFPTNRTHYCGVVWCGMLWFYQGPHSILLPHRLKIDWLKQEEAGSHSQGLITLTHRSYYEAEYYALQWETEWLIESKPLNSSAQSIISFYTSDLDGQLLILIRMETWTRSRESFMWIVYLVESG